MRAEGLILQGSILTRMFFTGAVAAVFLGLLNEAQSQSNRMAQLVFPFETTRAFSSHYNEVANSLTIELQNTSPSELDAIDSYDESLIRRAVVKDRAPHGTEIELILRDRNVQTSVRSFTEPFRVVVDLFDKDFSQQRDEATNYPKFASPQMLETEVGPKDSAKKNSTPEELAKADPLPSSAYDGKHESKNRMMQSAPPSISDPNEMRAEVARIDAGPGKSWKTYPPYIYRNQIMLMKVGTNPTDGSQKQASEIFTSGQAMADFAAQQFDLGNDQKALFGYNQVLYKDPKVFNRDPGHLWRLAEVHLGSGNLTLAAGYYQTITDEHSGSDLSAFAALRQLDIKAIRALEAGNFPNIALQLADAAKNISANASAEFQAQRALRDAYWRPETEQPHTSIPLAQADTTAELARQQKGLAQRTEFLARSVYLKAQLMRGVSWDKSFSDLVDDYLKRYKGQAFEPYRTEITNLMAEKFADSVVEKTNSAQYFDAIRAFDSLSKPLREAVRKPKTDLAMAESYRRAGQLESALAQYELATKDLSEGPTLFAAQFWTALTASQLRRQAKAAASDPDKIFALGEKARQADEAMAKSWKIAKEGERDAIERNLRDVIEQSLGEPDLLRTPPQVLLYAWTKKLNTKVQASSAAAAPGESATLSSPSAATILTLSKLATRFGELGMSEERKQTLALFKNFKPSQLGDSVDAKRTWVNDLMLLANDYRESNQLLEAGRTYALAGTEAENFEGRASALYKAGLLLYRAGKREEAVEALKTCSQDGGNRYYANLCTERLARLNSVSTNQ